MQTPCVSAWPHRQRSSSTPRLAWGGLKFSLLPHTGLWSYGKTNHLVIIFLFWLSEPAGMLGWLSSERRAKGKALDEAWELEEKAWLTWTLCHPCAARHSYTLSPLWWDPAGQLLQGWICCQAIPHASSGPFTHQGTDPLAEQAHCCGEGM